MDFKNKADSLAAKMNKITESLDLSEELIVEGDDLIEYVEEKTQDVKLYESSNLAELMNLELMTEDFKHVRDTLKEQSNNTRKVLNSLTLDLLDSDDDKRAGLIMSFAELNTALVKAEELFLKSYKEMSTTLLNLDKIRKNDAANPQTVNNTVNVTTTESVSTIDLIKKLKDTK